MNIVASSTSWPTPAMTKEFDAFENDFDLDMDDVVAFGKKTAGCGGGESDSLNNILNGSINSVSNHDSKNSAASINMDNGNFNFFDPLPFEEQELEEPIGLSSASSGSRSKRRSSMPSAFNTDNLPDLPQIHFGDYTDKLVSSNSERPARSRDFDDIQINNVSSTTKKLLSSASERPARSRRNFKKSSSPTPSDPGSDNIKNNRRNQLRRRHSANKILKRRGSTGTAIPMKTKSSTVVNNNNQYNNNPEVIPSSTTSMNVGMFGGMASAPPSMDKQPQQQQQQNQMEIEPLPLSFSESHRAKRRSSMPSVVAGGGNGFYGDASHQPAPTVSNVNINNNYITNSLSLELPNNNGKRELKITTTSYSTTSTTKPDGGGGGQFLPNVDPCMKAEINELNERLSQLESMRNALGSAGNVSGTGKQYHSAPHHSKVTRRFSMPSMHVDASMTNNPTPVPIPSHTFSSSSSPLSRMAQPVTPTGSGGNSKRNSVKRPQQSVPTQLSPVFVPSENDVICGRGKQFQSHAGNRRFKAIVEENVPRYMKATTKPEKSKVVISIVEQVRKEAGHGGFVDRDPDTGQWYEIGDTLAREKVGHALRFTIRSKANKPTTGDNKKTSSSSSSSSNNHKPITDKSEGKISPVTVKNTKDIKREDKNRNSATSSNVEEQIKSLKLKEVQKQGEKEKYRTIAEDAQDENFASFVLDTFLD